ncbi:MAG TPA: amino acid racemase [Firmicutes bacterium]|nr:amino acid racemase [Bacillota bacterium]
MEQKLGVLGGMGPQATQVFYQFVLDRTDAARDQDHLPTLILSDTQIPDRTQAILSGDTSALYQRLRDDAKLLERCGCTAIAIPCNTSHCFVDQLRGEVGVPILHMIRETARVLASQGKRRAGILATDGTLRMGLYQRECAAAGLEAVSPDPDTQRLVMSVIYDEIKQGETGSREKFAHIDRAIRAAGCDCAVLACTELSVFATYHPLPPFYLDAMAVLAQRAVAACGYPLRTI